MRSDPSLLIPGGIVVGFGFVLVASGAGRVAVAALPPAAVGWACLGAAALALAFRRGRPLVAVVVMTVAWGAMAATAGGADELRRFVLDCAAFLVPVNLAVAALVRERGPWSGATGWPIAAVLAQAALAWILWSSYSPWLPELIERPLWSTTGWTLGVLPQSASAVYAVAFTIAALRLAVSGAPADAAVLWTVIASALALAAGDAVAGRGLWLAAAGAVVVSVVHDGLRMAFGDALTGLAGRRAFDERLAHAGDVLTVAMVDVDRFKGINDRFGHDVGDQVLRMVASQLRAVGGGGRAFRVGGEEFAIVFSGRTAQQARPHVDAVRAAIESAQFSLRSPDRPRRKPERGAAESGPRAAVRVPVTVSIGIAQRTDRRTPAREVVDHADRALYRAKSAGRNRVVG